MERIIKTITKEKNIKVKMRKLDIVLEAIEVDKLIECIPKKDEFLGKLRKDLEKWLFK